MFVVISHMTALLYWRLAAIGLLPMPQKCQIASLEDAVSTIKGFSQEDFAWMYISPADLAERGIVVREALEPGLRLCVENGRVPKISELLDVGNMPMGAEEVRRRVLHALVKQAWTAVRQADRNAMGQACVGSVDGAVRTATGSAADELVNERPSLGFEFPARLDLLVGSQRARRTSRRVRSHVWKGDVPPGSLFRVNDSVLIVSPELLLAQLAEWRPADPHVVAVLGFELAGSYALLPRELIDCSKRIATTNGGRRSKRTATRCWRLAGTNSRTLHSGACSRRGLPTASAGGCALRPIVLLRSSAQSTRTCATQTC